MLDYRVLDLSAHAQHPRATTDNGGTQFRCRQIPRGLTGRSRNGSELASFAGRGFGGLYDAPDVEVGAFWSTLFGVLVVAAGQQMYWAGRRHAVISVVPGWFLLAVGLVGAWYVPVAPFWIAASLGAVTIALVHRRRRAHVNR